MRPPSCFAERRQCPQQGEEQVQEAKCSQPAALPRFPTFQGAGTGKFPRFLSLNCPGEGFLGFFSQLCLEPEGCWGEEGPRCAVAVENC